MNPEPRPAVLWDLDGVIVDTSEYHFQSWQQAFQPQGIYFTREHFKHAFGMANIDIIPLIMGKPVPYTTIKAIGDFKEATFRRLIKGNIRALPGVLELLKTLGKSNVPMAIVSSTPRQNIDLILGSLGIAACFEVIVSGDDIDAGKPDPQGYRLGARKLGIAPDYCIVIEDAVVGIEAARAAGMKCIAVATTHPAADLQSADYVVNNLDEIDPRILIDNNKRSVMERSLVLVKPDAMKRNLAGEILAKFQKKGLKMVALKMLHMDEALARRHYAVHQDKPFFKDLVAYITSAPVVAIIFEGTNAIELVRKTMGATDPKKAEAGTIRAEYGLDIQNNATHGSDSPENAAKEIEIFFGKNEIHSNY